MAVVALDQHKGPRKSNLVPRVLRVRNSRRVTRRALGTKLSNKRKIRLFSQARVARDHRLQVQYVYYEFHGIHFLIQLTPHPHPHIHLPPPPLPHPHPPAWAACAVFLVFC